MHRSARVIVAVLALLLLVAGTALATRANFGDEHRSPVAASHQPASPGESEDANEPSDSTDKDANESEDADEADGAPLTDAHAQALVDLLKDAGITATTDELKTLAAKYGVGGAVRLESWAKATGKSVTELAAMFDGGMGWGAIAHQLDVSPGIGWIMSHGHGNGHSNAGRALGKAKHQS